MAGRAERILLDRSEVQIALGFEVDVAPRRQGGRGESLGEVMKSAAAQVAYSSFSGTLATDDGVSPLAVGEMAVVFGADAIAKRTFDVVAEAAHLRIRLGQCEVAVETITASGGLVSYWGYVYLASDIVILTLDTIDPQAVSMTHFRNLVQSAAARLERLPAD